MSKIWIVLTLALSLIMVSPAIAAAKKKAVKSAVSSDSDSSEPSPWSARVQLGFGYSVNAEQDQSSDAAVAPSGGGSLGIEGLYEMRPNLELGFGLFPYFYGYKAAHYTVSSMPIGLGLTLYEKLPINDKVKLVSGLGFLFLMSAGVTETPDSGSSQSGTANGGLGYRALMGAEFPVSDTLKCLIALQTTMADQTVTYSGTTSKNTYDFNQTGLIAGLSMGF